MSFRVLGIGEVLWDLLPAGAQLGGAPPNFACHARALGADAAIVTRVGSDALGREILERLERLGLPPSLVQVDERAPTGTVTVALDADGVPRFTIHEDVAWDRLLAAARRLAAAAAGRRRVLRQPRAAVRAGARQHPAAGRGDARRTRCASSTSTCGQHVPLARDARAVARGSRTS